MKIELLLNRVSYGRAVKSGDLAFNGWFHGPASGDPDIDFAALPLIDLRKEPWGGLMVYGRTGQVFAVDDTAFALLQRLKDGESLEDLNGVPSPNSPEDIEFFQQQLKDNAIQI